MESHSVNISAGAAAFLKEVNNFAVFSRKEIYVRGLGVGRGNGFWMHYSCAY
jgi:hypothetical protein